MGGGGSYYIKGKCKRVRLDHKAVACKSFAINDKVKSTLCSIDLDIHDPSEVIAYAQNTIKSRLGKQASLAQPDNVPRNLHLIAA